MPCCCSHSCRVQVALQWLGVGQHSPTTSPATWISEDSNHYRWKEETVRSPGQRPTLSAQPHTTVCHPFLLSQVVPNKGPECRRNREWYFPSSKREFTNLPCEHPTPAYPLYVSFLQRWNPFHFFLLFLMCQECVLAPDTDWCGIKSVRHHHMDLFQH